jgi:cyclic pyranopterin phosphate synthase
MKALEAGLRVKVNCVPIRGVNEEEIIPISRLAETHPADVRYIERMPAGEGGCHQGISGAEIMERLSAHYPDLRPVAPAHGFGPARYYQSGRLKGGIGFIDALSNHFCCGCNRLRLTSEGFLKLCLYHEDGLDLRRMLRGGAKDSKIEKAMERAAYHKPKRHAFGEKTDVDKGIGAMSRIGG